MKPFRYSYPPDFEHDTELAIWQNPFECKLLLKLLQSHSILEVLEIGTGHGLFGELLKSNGINVWGIDSNPDAPVQMYDGFFRGSSASPQATEWARSHHPFHAVFIDGDHSYESVHRDFHLYSRFANKMIILHDIGGNRAGKYPTDSSVKKFWNQLRRVFNTVEIYASHPYYCGVGIIIL